MLGRHMAFRPTPQCNSSRVSNTLDPGVHKSKLNYMMVAGGRGGQMQMSNSINELPSACVQAMQNARPVNQVIHYRNGL